VDALHKLPDDAFANYLAEWRVELHTTLHGYLKCKRPKLASRFPDTFPNLDALRAYAQPVTSESEALLDGISLPVPQIQWTREHSLGALAKFCEERFEWGTTQMIPKRFRSLLWHGSTIRVLRRAALDLDQGEDVSIDVNDKHLLLSSIVASTTAHPQTDYLHEYRVELDPYHLL